MQFLLSFLFDANSFKEDALRAAQFPLLLLNAAVQPHENAKTIASNN
jgi:hypothetical protein